MRARPKPLPILWVAKLFSPCPARGVDKKTTHAMPCIFRPPKSAGARCTAACVHDTRFCSSHRRHCSNPLFGSMSSMLDTDSSSAILSSSNLYTCVARFWDAAGVAMRAPQYACAEGITDVVEMLSYLLSSDQIQTIAHELRMTAPCGAAATKQRTLMTVASCMWRLWLFARCPRALGALVRGQKKWRSRRGNCSPLGPWPLQPAVNGTDPFTLEDLSSLQTTSVFSYRDQSGLVYAFDIQSLYQHVVAHDKPVNPLNRQPLPPATVQRLKDCMLWRFGTRPDHAPASPNYRQRTWDSPIHAFTDLTILIEQLMGVFLQPQWFQDMCINDVVCIFHRFHRMAGRAGRPHMWMSRLMPQTDHLTCYAREMLALTQTLQGSNGNAFLMCCALVATAAWVPHVDAALPEWVFDAAGM